MKDTRDLTIQISARVNTLLEYSAELNMQITPLRLQKLLYIDYSRYLSVGGEQLQEFKFESWQYGPVLPSVYHYYKQDWWGKKIINHKIPANDNKYYTLPTSEREKTRDTVRKYALFSDQELVDFTHVEGGGWDNVYDEQNPGGVITQDEIKKDALGF